MKDIQNKLQLKHFRLLHSIHVCGQLALAAERLFMTQPAASRMLGEIERVVGQSVFTRHPKGMSATPIGEVLARHAAGLLKGLDEAIREVKAFQAGRVGAVRIGAVTGAAVGFVVPAVQELKKAISGVDIHIDVAPSDVLIAGLLEGNYDFVLARIPAGIDARQFIVLSGQVEIIKFLVRDSHPLAHQHNHALGDLAGYEWVIQASGTPIRQAVEQAFISQGIPLPQEIVNTTSLLVMIAYLASSNAIAAISREVADLLGPTAVGAKLAALSMCEPIIIHPYHLISRKNQIISPLAMHLRELVFAAMGTSPVVLGDASDTDFSC